MQPYEINRDIIATMLPHSGDMVLIDNVESFDNNTLCTSITSHRRDAHPLTSNEELASVILIEYAAQAAGLHRALHAYDKKQKPTLAYLASLSDVYIAPVRINIINDNLILNVNLILAEATKAIYRFKVLDNDVILCKGQMVLAEPV